MASKRARFFIKKLIELLKDETRKNAIVFRPAKARIYIMDRKQLEKEVLRKYFRHGNLSSFVRQLNLYGFKKIKNNQMLCFTHPNLQAGLSEEQSYQRFLTIANHKISKSENQSASPPLPLPSELLNESSVKLQEGSPELPQTQTKPQTLIFAPTYSNFPCITSYWPQSIAYPPMTDWSNQELSMIQTASQSQGFYYQSQPKSWMIPMPQQWIVEARPLGPVQYVRFDGARNANQPSDSNYQ